MDNIYSLLDDLEEAASCLDDAAKALKYFPDEQDDTKDLILRVKEKYEELQKVISEFENKEKRALEREYYKNLL